MSGTDIMTVDPSELIDFKDIKINEDLPKDQRIIDVIKQTGGNPYFYRHGKRVVKLSFSETDTTFDEIFESKLRK